MSDSSQFLEDYLKSGLSQIVVISYEHHESGSGHAGQTTETVVAKKGNKFIRATLHEERRFQARPGSGKSLDEEEISEKEYKKLVGARTVIDSSDVLADLEERKERAAKYSKFRTEFLETTPDCPKCGGRMVNRKGPHGQFWGCSDYPRCRGTADFSLETKKRYRKWADC